MGYDRKEFDKKVETEINLGVVSAKRRHHALAVEFKEWFDKYMENPDACDVGLDGVQYRLELLHAFGAGLRGFFGRAVAAQSVKPALELDICVVCLGSFFAPAGTVCRPPVPAVQCLAERFPSTGARPRGFVSFQPGMAADSSKKFVSGKVTACVPGRQGR